MSYVLSSKAKDAKDLIEMAAQGGKIVQIQFEKKDGSIRDMNARLGVKKYTSGGTRSTAANPNILGVYDMALRKELTEEEGKRAYRSLDLNRVISVNGRNMQITFK